MQKIKLANETYIENIIEINDYKNKDTSGRKVLNFTIINSDYDSIINTFKTGNTNFSTLNIYSQDETEEYYISGTQVGYTIFGGVECKPDETTFIVQMIQDSVVVQLQAIVQQQSVIIEQQQATIDEIQIAVAEVGTFLGGI